MEENGGKPIEKAKFTHRSLRRNSLENDGARVVFTGSREVISKFEGFHEKIQISGPICLNILICMKFLP